MSFCIIIHSEVAAVQQLFLHHTFILSIFLSLSKNRANERWGGGGLEKLAAHNMVTLISNEGSLQSNLPFKMLWKVCPSFTQKRCKIRSSLVVITDLCEDLKLVVFFFLHLWSLKIWYFFKTFIDVQSLCWLKVTVCVCVCVCESLRHPLLVNSLGIWAISIQLN